jgi:hypothetical protein
MFLSASPFVLAGDDLMAVSADIWLDLIQREYFDDFIAVGGGAVRFAVTEPGGIDDLARALTDRAEGSGLAIVSIDLASIRLHMLQTVVFAAASALPWERLLQTRLEALVLGAGYRWPAPGQMVPFAVLAEQNEVAVHLLRRDLTQALSREIWHDPRLTQDFRYAMIALLEARLTGDEPALAEAVMGWLRGTLGNIGQLKGTQIGRKIGRQNARATLMSLCHWVRVCGGRGLLLLIDITRLHCERRAVTDGLFYTPASVMDCYEVLRQLIDDSAHLPGLFVAVLADDAFLSDDPRRSLGQYTALQMRIWDDVRPLGGDNPLAPLVRIMA